MKIGLMGAWNTDSGASIHAELVGREWVKSGHQLAVFSFYDYSIHGTALTDRDEDYVTRCFTTFNHPQVRFNPLPFLKNDYQIFIVEDLGMLPQDSLGKIFHWIKRKAKTVTVIHDGKLTENPSFYQFAWDAIIGFDERYVRFLKEGYPNELVHYIPYPCHPPTFQDKESVRRRLNLPLDKKILFMFGPAAGTGVETIPWILESASDYPLHILVVSKDKKAVTRVRDLSTKNIELRKEILTLPQLYDHLHASDALIFNKSGLPHVAVSSTVFQCLGSGCPIIARKSNFVETLPEEVLQFKDQKEFESCLIDILEESEKVEKTVENARKYASDNSGEVIARKFIKLFEEL